MIWTYLGGIGGKELICLRRRLKETLIQSLVWEDPLEEGMTTHFSILAWRIPWTQEPGGLQSTGSQRVGHDRGTNTFTFGGFEVAVGLCIRRVY